MFNKNSRPISIKESLLLSGVWIGLALLFNLALVFTHGSEAALNFLAGYLIEKSLSIDNLFVFLLIFTYFNPPPQSLHKVLFWGVLGAIVMRGLFIFAGVALVKSFHWILYLFGAFLIVIAIKLAQEKNKKFSIEGNFILKLFRKLIPTTPDYVGDKFFVKDAGRYLATPLALVLVLIEASDIVFAIDSIPAIFAITLDPFIIYTSNIFAILGLRALYFALSGMLPLFHYLHYGLALLLGFTGVKLLTADFFPISITFTLVFIVCVLAGSILLSFLRPPKVLPILLFLALTPQVYANSIDEIPILYQGRFRPLDAAANLWLDNIAHTSSLDGTTATDLLWQIHLRGHRPWDETPFLWAGNATVKELLGLEPQDSRFSYRQLHRAIDEDPTTNGRLTTTLLTYHAAAAYLDPSNRSSAQKLELTKLAPGLWVVFKGDDLTVGAAPTTPPWNFLKKDQLIGRGILSQARQQLKALKKTADELSSLLQAMSQYASWQGSSLPDEASMESTLQRLRERVLSPHKIAHAIETQHPLRQRLITAGSLIKALPGRSSPGEWFSLHALKVRVYDPQTDRLIPVSNFTVYRDDQFQAIRTSYLTWEKTPSHENLKLLAEQLHLAYQDIAGTPYAKASGKELSYPTVMQLKIESLYTQSPWIWGIILLYSTACLCLLLPYRALNTAGMPLMATAFALHTVVLAARCFILQRPPVSNMFETVIYVPWIGVLVSFFLSQRLAIISASIASILLLVILQLTNLHSSLDNVQAVLDSQFWLSTHVLMVVGSYGVFLLSSVLGHLYLGSWLYHQGESPTMRRVANLILQTLYIGTALLITGTILGGVWAAESWGRFWDWDPKESWAFISSCVYVIFIHAYRFHKIQQFGLAVGAVVGFLAISFTWYGVNYILGTGLHSYGFGSGGEVYYYMFLALELVFVGLALAAIQRNFSPQRKD